MYLKKIGVCDNNIYERLSNAWDRYTLLKGERDMLKINQEKCKKCQICAKNCPIGAIAVEPGADGKKVEYNIEVLLYSRYASYRCG